MLHQTILTPGVHQISAERYHADPAPEPSLSSTLAKILINETPRHAWTASPRLNPMFEPVEKKQFDIGRAAHEVILGIGGGYDAIPAEFLASNGAASTKEAKAFIDGCRAKGVTPLKDDELGAVLLMADAVHDRLRAMGILLDPSRSEMAALAQVDGIWCRCMVDNAPTDPRLPLYDLKTTAGSVNPEALTRTVADYGYDVQAAHYLRVWKEATGEDRRFRFVFVEKKAPYEVGVVELYADGTMRPASNYEADEALTGDWFADAEQKLSRARRQWRECLDTGVWPGYPARVALIGAPIWHRKNAAIAHGYDPILPQKPGADALERAAAWQSPN